MGPESWEGSWERGDGTRDQQNPPREETAWTFHGELGPGTSTSGARGEGSRWSCSFMDPAPWDQRCGRATGVGAQGQHCSFGLPLSPSWGGIRVWKGCGAQLYSKPGTAGNCSAGASQLLVRLGISSSRPPAAPPCPLPAAPPWLSARGTGISALPFPGMGWETPLSPALSWAFS